MKSIISRSNNALIELSTNHLFQKSFKLTLHSVTLQTWDMKQVNYAYIFLPVGYTDGRKRLIPFEKKKSLNLPINIPVRVLIYIHPLLFQQWNDILQ